METKKRKKACRKKRRTYSSRFLTTNSMKNRGDKAIYVRSDYHYKLCWMAKILGGGNIPLYAYLDNILAHHFKKFAGAIKEDVKNVEPKYLNPNQ